MADSSPSPSPPPSPSSPFASFSFLSFFSWFSFSFISLVLTKEFLAFPLPLPLPLLPQTPIDLLTLLCFLPGFLIKFFFLPSASSSGSSSVLNELKMHWHVVFSHVGSTLLTFLSFQLIDTKMEIWKLILAEPLFVALLTPVITGLLPFWLSLASIFLTVSGAFLTLTNSSSSASSTTSSSYSLSNSFWIIFGATVLSCARVVLVARQIRQMTTLDIVNSNVDSSYWSPAPTYFVSLSYHSFGVFLPLFLLFRFLSFFSSSSFLESSFATLPPLLLPSVSPSSYIFLLISLIFFTSLSLLFSFHLLLQMSPVNYSLLTLLLNFLWLFFFAKEESSSFSSSSISPLTFTGFSLLYVGLLLYFYIHFPSSSFSSSCASCSSSSSSYAFSSSSSSSDSLRHPSRGHQKYSSSLPTTSLFLPLLLPLLLFLLAGLLLYAPSPSPSQSSSSVMFPPEVEMSQTQTQVHGYKCIQSLRFKLFEVFRPLLLKNKPVILMSVPWHDNLGDSFIWEGERHVVSALGGMAVYTCTMWNCQFEHVEKILHDAAVERNLSSSSSSSSSSPPPSSFPDPSLFPTSSSSSFRTTTSTEDNQLGTIVLTGGGNFGDLYRVETEYRNKVIQKFTNVRIVVFPQSVTYRDLRLAKNDSMLYSSHPDLHLTARDRVSFSFLSQHFNKTKHHLSPDAAFAIGPVAPNCEPTLDVVFLLREDTEKRKPKEGEGEEQAFEMLREAGLSFLRTDWNLEVQQPYYFNRKSRFNIESLPLHRLHRGNNILCQGKVIVTDRLHASILGVLLGKPVFVLNNQDGKIFNLFDTWEDQFFPECSYESLHLMKSQSLFQATQKVLDLLLKQS